MTFAIPLLIACGGSSSSIVDQPEIIIEQPGEGEVFRASDVVQLRISTVNFPIVPPLDRAIDDPTPMVGAVARLISFYIDESQLLDTEGEFDPDRGEENGHDDSADLVHAEQEDHDDSLDTEHTEEQDAAGHDDEHADNSSNPAARQGHVHVYLNHGVGSDPHISAWVNDIPVQLPEDLELGTHCLRVELRDDQHLLVDSAYDQTVCFEIAAAAG